jgi:hypothetical protein
MCFCFISHVSAEYIRVTVPFTVDVYINTFVECKILAYIFHETEFSISNLKGSDDGV